MERSFLDDYDDPLQVSWFSDEDVAHIYSKFGDGLGRRFAIIGGYPKQTILRHVENLCFKNDSSATLSSLSSFGLQRRKKR